MKIRTSFVSNSSSSSFLVIYDRPEDFDVLLGRFDEPKGILLNDLSAERQYLAKTDGIDASKKIAEFIRNRLYMELDNYFHNLVDKFCPPKRCNIIDCSNHAGEESYAEFARLINELSHGEVNVMDFVKLVDATRNEMRDDFEMRHAENEDFLNDNHEYNRIWDFCHDRIGILANRGEIDVLASRISEKWPNALVACYEDHCDAGAWMEHDFMPMLASKNGEVKWLVFRNNEH